MLVIDRLRNLGSTPDLIARRCVLGNDTKCCFLPWGQAVYPLWRPSMTKDMQAEQLLYWSGMTDTEHVNNSCWSIVNSNLFRVYE